MKILSITAQKPHSTGSGTYLTELVNSMSRMGHEQAVIAGIYRDDVVCFPSEVDFYPVFFSSDYPIYGMSDVMPYPSQLYSSMTKEDAEHFESLFAPVILRAVEELDPDIIFCHHLFLLTAIVRRLCPDRKVYGLSHGSDLRQFRQSPVLQELVRPGIASLDRVYALHDAQKLTVSELFGVAPEAVHTAGSGYNSNIFNQSGRMPGESGILKISYAGKLSKAKGIEEFMEAGIFLADDPDFPEFEFVLAGGCQEDAIREAIKQPFVNYVGMLNQKELAEVLKGSDIFVLPSYYEGLPLVIMEAMACGAVPVCTDLPGVKAWVEASIPGSTAIFAARPEMKSVDEPTDEAKPIFAHELADRIREALGVSEKLARGEIASPAIENASWDACARRIYTQ